MAGHVVAEHDDDVGVQCIGSLDDPLDAVERHPGIAGVKIGDDGDLELEIGGPLRRRKVVADDAKLQRGFGEPVSRGRDAERAQATKEFKEMSA